MASVVYRFTSDVAQQIATYITLQTVSIYSGTEPPAGSIVTSASYNLKSLSALKDGKSTISLYLMFGGVETEIASISKTTAKYGVATLQDAIDPDIFVSTPLVGDRLQSLRVAVSTSLHYQWTKSTYFDLTIEYDPPTSSNPPVIINHPTDNSQTCNAQPRILLTTSDSVIQSLDATGYSQSHASPYQPGDKLILQKAVPLTAPTDATVDIWTKDSSDTEEITSVTYQYSPPNYIQPNIVQHQTIVKGEYIRELRTLINQQRHYYGLDDVDWNIAIIDHQTPLLEWSSIVNEMRQSLDDVITKINEWDSQADSGTVIPPQWISETYFPTKAVMDQLRSVIESL